MGHLSGGAKLWSRCAKPDDQRYIDGIRLRDAPGGEASSIEAGQHSRLSDLCGRRMDRICSTGLRTVSRNMAVSSTEERAGAARVPSSVYQNARLRESLFGALPEIGTE